MGRLGSCRARGIVKETPVTSERVEIRGKRSHAPPHPEEGYNLALPADPSVFNSLVSVLPSESPTHTARNIHQQDSFPETPSGQLYRKGHPQTLGG